MLRTSVFEGLYWGPPNHANCHVLVEPQVVEAPAEALDKPLQPLDLAPKVQVNSTKPSKIQALPLYLFSVVEQSKTTYILTFANRKPQDK